MDALKVDDLTVGSIVTIEGSDTCWEILVIDKGTLSLRDDGMGIIELEGVPIDEVTGVVE